MTTTKRRFIISSVLIALAIGLLWPIYNAPVWWVSLEAPNYPEEAFPDGVRIMFHFNGVFSGCQLLDKDEVQEAEALDCAHEMDTINHYVGMYPIASGGPVELFFSLFLIVMVAVMLLTFLCIRPKIRLMIMGIGFTAIVIWMGLAFYGHGGLKYHSSRYLAGRITALGESAEEDEAEAEMTPGEALIARLKASLAETEEAPEPVAEEGDLSERQESINYLRNAFEQDQSRMSTKGQDWQGSGAQLLAWHYEKSLGRYFRDKEVLGPLVAGMVKAGNVLFWGIVAVMVLLLAMARKPQGLFNWLLVLAPAGLPLYFVIEYSTWLWWYGHNMNEMGAFTLKSFMPTVFGQGKVAQFTTNSYPSYGFWLMVLFSVLLIVAALLRREPSTDEDDE